jgi:hypothetical protein
VKFNHPVANDLKGHAADLGPFGPTGGRREEFAHSSAGRPPRLPLALVASAWAGVTVFVHALTMTLRL